MLFNSPVFPVFFPVAAAGYYIFPVRYRYLWLLAVSFFFYMWRDAKYALLLLLCISLTYFSGLAIGKLRTSSVSEPHNRRLRKAVLAFSFLLNLGILFVFKYAPLGFAITQKLLGLFHIYYTPPVFDILLPVGISFFTFQALGYTADVYKEKIPPEKNFLKYALFVSFFPQLVAGPIERSCDLLPQLSCSAGFDLAKAREGLLLMLRGYFLKTVIADRAAVFVNEVYDYPEYRSGMYLIAATVLFALMIYCDFAGYSTIAVGSAKILGIELTDNFREPYLSVSISDFWKRWHISLTSWFRDYLYIPLGGNRKGRLRKYCNEFVVFTVSGLWHGADVTFVIWGALNGVLKIAEEILSGLLAKHKKSTPPKAVRLMLNGLRGMLTFVLICFTWIFFRANSLADAFTVIRSIFTVNNPEILTNGAIFSCGLDKPNFIFLLICFGILLLTDILKKNGLPVSRLVSRARAVPRSIFIACAVCFILLFGMWGPSFNSMDFIYFRF